MNESKLLSQLDAMQMLMDVNKVLDECAHSQGISFTTMDTEMRIKGALSTGIYCFDLITGGGYAPGRFSYLYGDTGSAKSTTCYHGILSSICKNIITVINDHEVSLDPTYMKKIGVDVDDPDICGFRNKKGSWEKTPRLRYAMGTTAEATFKFMNKTMKSLPDKIQLHDAKANEYRYFLIHPEYQYKLTWASINKGLDATIGEGKDKKPAILEISDFSPQMVFVTDSLKSMLPEAKDVDIDSDPIALLARCFSLSFPLVKSLLGRKNCIYLATNHLTTNPMARFQCLHADTTVPFVDGRSPTMREIVENKIQGEVWSFDEETKQIVPRKIIDWYYNGDVEKPEDFVTVTCDAVDTSNGVASFTCTLDHEVLTEDGWKQAGSLTSKDKLVTKYQSKINGSLKSFLLGAFIGDCTFASKDDGVNSIRLQDNTNPAYVDWKFDKLSEHFNFKYVNAELPFFNSETRHEFTVWKRRIGQRDPLAVIDEMDDLSLAVWFMDDGNGSDGSGTWSGTISVKRLKDDAARLSYVQERLACKGLNCELQIDAGVLRFNKDAFLALCERICCYIPRCMQYKLPPDFRGRYVDFDLECAPTVEKEYVSIRSVKEGSARKFRQKGKYDISIEGTHNYMVGNVANGVVVHNSPETEPGGKAVQFYPDLKLKMHINRAQSKIIEEKNVGGGLDRYIEGKATVLKNKAGPCFRSIPFRVWVDENSAPGRGIDPVFDAYTFLDSIGVIEKTSKTGDIFGINMKGWETDSFDWKKFKELVLVRPEGDKLRDEIEAMLADGSAQEKYYQTLSNPKTKDKKKKEEIAKIDEETEVETMEI